MTLTNSELREAVKDGLANHTGEFANPWIFKGSYSHELLADILNDIMASERLFKNLEALINNQIIEAKVEENQTYLDRINNYKPDPNAPSFGSASGAMETAGWKQAFIKRIEELRTTK